MKSRGLCTGPSAGGLPLLRVDMGEWRASRVGVQSLHPSYMEGMMSPAEKGALKQQFGSLAIWLVKSWRFTLW